MSQDLFPAADIGIIGYGIVGQALAYGLSETSQKRDRIKFYDKYKEGSLPLEEVVKSSEFIFIGLPTPMKKDESGIDLSIIDENIASITPLTNNTDKIIIIKSTVIPGTTRRYAQKYPQTNFCFNPEFLTEANSLKDFLTADRTVIGADSDLISRRVAMLYQQRFPNSKIYQTDPSTAEMIKYFANTYLALKVSFANQIYDLCKKIGIEYEEMKNIATADERIGKSHLGVTTERGFGQKCFPKDTVAILGLAKELGVSLSVLKEAWEYNKKVRSIHDWEEIPFAVTNKNPQ